MNRLWYFNPENDIALAADTAGFTPPPAAVALKRAGELLPLFMASETDAVICGGVNRKWLDDFKTRFGIKATVWNHNPEGFKPEPWGWSKAARHFFEQNGFTKEAIPSDVTLEVIRQLSHRRTAAKVAEIISSTSNLPIWPRAFEVADVNALERSIKEFGKAVVKAPWSSSGRGVKFFDAAKGNMEAFLTQSAGTIKRQGTVMVEKQMSFHHDFALLFYCSEGSCFFAGPSVFIAEDKTGNYIGNIAANDDYLFGRLHEFVSENILTELIEELRAAVETVIAPHYSGPLGVDICFGGENLESAHIHICEINLRYTMGFVAQGIARHTARPAIIATAAEVPKGTVALTPPGNKPVFCLKNISEPA